ncbi:DHH family phosphoesterase [Candidatus Woesearchaeota archaeon]|nr:DHH family phosphoesterase [Candidatus Woesearchaeota archaeon]
MKQKRVTLCTHWDTDGVTSAALIYHLIKNDAKQVNTVTKGKKFLIEPEDVKQETDVIICTDIQPSKNLKDLKKKIVYIDHHPTTEKGFDLTIYDETAQSTTLVVFEKIMGNTTKNPYYLFLTLLGFFGDGGDRENIPAELHVLSNQLIPELMQKRDSFYNNKGYYYEIERYVSLLNLGKRVFWSGDIPLELLKSLESYEPIIYNLHPLTQELYKYKSEMREIYEQEIELKELSGINYCIISNERNVQGVLAAKHINDKPIMVLNEKEGEIIGSFRVPEASDFDAGEFLNKFNNKINGFLGGGHCKAGGFTMPKEALKDFFELLKKE